MKQCPKCGRQVETEAVCRTCGLVLLGGGVAPDEKPAAVPQPAPADPASKPNERQPHLFALLIVIVVTGLGSLMLLASATRGTATPASNDVKAAHTNAVSPAATPTRSIDTPKAAAAPQWMTNVPARRAGFGTNAVVFELPSDQEIDVWRKRVRPVLTVRCAANATEVFVVTQSPAAIEPNSSQHTVKVSFDGGSPAPQTWEHSVDHDALFAPEGRALARQIAGSRKMWFTFTPFNASPAVIPFTVDGFDAHLKSAGGKCS